MATRISFEGEVFGDVTITPDGPRPRVSLGETDDWITERNEQLGVSNEFLEPGGAQPYPLGFVPQDVREDPMAQMDEFYHLYVGNAHGKTER